MFDLCLWLYFVKNGENFGEAIYSCCFLNFCFAKKKKKKPNWKIVRTFFSSVFCGFLYKNSRSTLTNILKMLKEIM